MSQTTVNLMTLEQVQDAVRAVIREVVPAQNLPGKKRILCPREVEKEYGFGVRQLERWRAEGIGPQYTTVGRLIFYERAVLDEYIASGRVMTGVEA